MQTQSGALSQSLMHRVNESNPLLLFRLCQAANIIIPGPSYIRLSKFIFEVLSTFPRNQVYYWSSWLTFYFLCDINT